MEEVQEVGLCRKNAPTTSNFDDSLARHLGCEWPETIEDDWCGEFKAGSPLFLLEDLCFSVRTRNGLRKMEIKTEKEFLNLTRKDILRRKNLGMTSLREIQRKQMELKAEYA